ncbi:radical SAM protein [Elusimicrobiota bacterium]
MNKHREISRLIYEISKKENMDFRRILKDYDTNKLNFADFKEKLQIRRYLKTYAIGEKVEPYLPELDIDPKNKVKINEKKQFYPKNIYFEGRVKDTEILDKLQNYYRKAEFTEIESFKDYIKENEYTIKTYNDRRENLFVINEKYDFFKKCPCTTDCVCCNYYIFNLNFGCPYECTYCYLQEYTNIPGIVISANIEDYFKAVEKDLDKSVRMGNGEFADSLALDDITGYSAKMIEFFRKYPEIMFEFKTKSSNIANILKTKPAENVVIAWSMNPQKFIDENEFFCANLNNRINAAKECINAGFQVAFHFDPIVFYDNWEEDYKNVVDMIFDSMPGEKISWISLGTFRFSRSLKKVIENRFPENKILDGELIPGFDGKLRYNEAIRVDIYRKMAAWIKNRNIYPYVYLCMESREIWNNCELKPLWHWQGKNSEI